MAADKEEADWAMRPWACADPWRSHAGGRASWFAWAPAKHGHQLSGRPLPSPQNTEASTSLPVRRGKLRLARRRLLSPFTARKRRGRAHTSAGVATMMELWSPAANKGPRPKAEAPHLRYHQALQAHAMSAQQWLVLRATTCQGAPVDVVRTQSRTATSHGCGDPYCEHGWGSAAKPI